VNKKTSYALIIAAFLLSSPPTYAAEFLWTGQQTDSWLNGNNWNSPDGSVPGINDSAVFTDITRTSFFNIFLRNNRQVGSVSFVGDDAYSLNGFTLSLGKGNISTSGTASHTINSNIQLLDHGLWNIAAGSSWFKGDATL